MALEEMNQEQVAALSPEDLEKYQSGLRYCRNEWAGGYDGWSNGHKLLKEVGYTEHRREEGHRTFVRLEPPKPQPNNVSKEKIE